MSLLVILLARGKQCFQNKPASISTATLISTVFVTLQFTLASNVMELGCWFLLSALKGEDLSMVLWEACIKPIWVCCFLFF